MPLTVSCKNCNEPMYECKPAQIDEDGYKLFAQCDSCQEIATVEIWSTTFTIDITYEDLGR